MSDATPNVFAYTAQTFEGKAMSGTIDAASQDDATQRLSGRGLPHRALPPSGSHPPRRPSD